MYSNHAEVPFVILPWLCFTGCLACLFFSIRNGRAQRLVDDTPTSKTTGVFIGLVELKGSAEVESPLIGYLSERQNVYNSWTVEEHWSRTVVESCLDSKGIMQTRTRTETGWTQVAGERQEFQFYLRDDCGVVRVQPMKAKIEPLTIFNETCGPTNPLYYQKGPAGAIADSTFTRRFVEDAIPLHAPIFLIGHAREREDVVAAEIAFDAQTTLFLISTRSEEQVSTGYQWAFWGLGLFGLVLTVVGTIMVEQGRIDLPTYLPPLLAGIGYLAIWEIGWFWMVYNSIVNLRERTRQAWANVDVQLKRRHDLIPNLVSTVETLRDYERTVQTEVVRLRAELTATPPGEAGPDHGAVTGAVAAIVESYPELKSNASFLNLMQNLSDTEQRIALARAYFNEIATFFNTRLQVIPDKFVASVGAMKPQILMAANDFERAPVSIKLAS